MCLTVTPSGLTERTVCNVWALLLDWTVMSRLAAVFGVAVLLTATPVFAQKQITSELVAAGFDHPVAFVQDPAHPNLQLVVEQHGHVRALLGGVIQDTDFLDLS